MSNANSHLTRQKQYVGDIVKIIGLEITGNTFHLNTAVNLQTPIRYYGNQLKFNR